MKSITTLLLCLITVFVFSQETTNLKVGTAILNKEIADNYTTPTSILFKFTTGGDAHFLPFYNDLQKKLRSRFKKSKIQLGFELDKTPNKISHSFLFKKSLKTFEKQLNDSDFETICYISLSEIHSTHLSNKMGVIHKTNLRLISVKDKMPLINAKFESTSPIVMRKQNKNMSKMIFELLVTE